MQFFLRTLALSILSYLPWQLSAQGTINGPSVECLGNLTNFSYTPPSGLSVNSITWHFGDGITSNSQAPTHTYQNKGTYTVKVQANLSNGSSTNDSMKLEVKGLPKASFYYIPGSDTCFLRNKVCVRDTSNPHEPGQSLVSRMIVWGDGSFSTSSNPGKGDSVCHTYQTYDKYTLRIEVTDKFGCKSSQNMVRTIAENVQPLFSMEGRFIDCNTYELCVKNFSIIGGKLSNAEFKWYVDSLPLDTNSYFNSSKCIRYTKSKNVKLKLIGSAKNLCVDTLTRSFNVVIDPLPTSMTIFDTVKCFGLGGLNTADIGPVNRTDINWYVENEYFGLPENSTQLYFETKYPAGMREVKAEIIRGSCIHIVKGYFRMLGPYASVTTIDNDQCFSNREVFFIDNSKGINRDQVTYKWFIDDDSGENCINYRAKDINKYRNCIESRDWYTRHKFPESDEPFIVFMVVTDTVTGCFDTGWSIVDMKYCSSILIPDTFDICQGMTFKDMVPPPAPIKFTIDSGKLWRDFGTVLDAPIKGSFDLGHIFKTTLYEWAETIGDDSIAVHKDTIDYFDTIFRKQILNVHEPKLDSFKVKIYNECRPFRVTVDFDKGEFNYMDKLQIVWADTGNIDSTFMAYTKLDSVVHIYNRPGFSANILIKLEDKYGCWSIYRHEINKGTAMSYSTPKFINCIKDSTCIYPGIYNFRTNSFLTGNTPNNKISWYFPDGGGYNQKFNPCVRFNKGGFLPFQMFLSDSFGCKDTLRDSIFIQDVRAGYKHTAKVIYCSELKQFFDSSSFFKNPSHRDFYPVKYIDSIKVFSWQFGDGTFSSFQRNPLQTLNTSMDKIKAAHAVETYSGCKDTVYFEIAVVGPKPYFHIRDTIGCNSLNTEFVNLSRNCKRYIWNFGDSANTSLQVSDKQTVNFNYTKPGRYFINLIGIDTVFNPFTGKMESCFNTFPDKLFQKDTHRTVLVLPLVKTGITSIDTICTDVVFPLTSLSDSGYIGEYWDLGDTTIIDTAESPSTIAHSYQKAGIYTVKLSPYYNNSIQDRCRDSAVKTIVVMGVDADFDIDPGSTPPLFKFNNKSNPLSAAFLWDFDQNGASQSTEVHPSYNYGNDTGSYNVCLIASIPYGCADTVCKLVVNDYLSAFQIGNVFTPGVIDDKNDQFDILIEGEASYDLQIYNRWGVLVYESDEDSDNSENKNWNGRVFNNGEICPSGTYYYIFTYSLKGSKDKYETLQGVITLIR